MILTPYRWLSLLLLLTLPAGCIGIRSPLPPDQSPIAVPAAEGVVSTTFSDMIREVPENYEITVPNIGGRFEGEPFRIIGRNNNPPVSIVATLHFKQEEPLDVYVRRFFNNLDVPAFEPIEGTEVEFAATERKHYYAIPVFVDERDGWLMLEATATNNRMVLSRYQGWFVEMLEGATVTRVS
jgi:hypothetical protein